MEQWAEGHETHAAIFKAAITRYRTYCATNQLRTWHEVFILPSAGQRFEYLNYSPDTGLLPWFEAKRLDKLVRKRSAMRVFCTLPDGDNE